MTAEPQPLRTARHRDTHHRWEMVSRPPAAPLAPYVTDLQGYREHATRPLRRLQVPFAGLPLIISLGPSIDIEAPEARNRWERHCSFLAGLHDGYARTEYRRAQHGLQVNLTPLGAIRLLGRPLRELTNRVVRLDDLLGPQAERLTARLAETPDWTRRLDLLERFLASRLHEANGLTPGIAWAWHRLRESAGRQDVSGLARELGWSRKHLTQQFHAQIGLPPKALARVLRFKRATTALDRGPCSLSALAQDCGYYDQAHFNRDFRAFAGCTPSAYLRGQLPDAGGIAAG